MSKASEQTSIWSREGHLVFIGPVQAEVRQGKNRYYRQIFLDGVLIGKSEGKDLASARYRSVEAVERTLKVAKPK